MRCYSSFWLAYAAGLICLSPIWQDRAEPDPEAGGPAVHPAETMPMERWMRLPDEARAAVVAQYAQRKPRISKLGVRA